MTSINGGFVGQNNDCLTQKDLRDKIIHVVEEVKKDVDSRFFFALNGLLERWEMCP